MMPALAGMSGAEVAALLANAAKDLVYEDLGLWGQHGNLTGGPFHQRGVIHGGLVADVCWAESRKTRC